jgi:catalase
MSDKPALTTTAGSPAGDNQNAITAGRRGPDLLGAWHRFIVPAMKPKRSPE